jgi:hypothetical protein
MGPYVKAGLDAARREMGFCFRQAGGSPAGASAPVANPDAPSSEPAVLLLYLEAREGAIDVVGSRTEFLGASTAALVDCCREVLRGWEIPAFGAVPGRRYRVKFQLQ